MEFKNIRYKPGFPALENNPYVGHTGGWLFTAQPEPAFFYEDMFHHVNLK